MIISSWWDDLSCIELEHWAPTTILATKQKHELCYATYRLSGMPDEYSVLVSCEMLWYNGMILIYRQVPVFISIILKEPGLLKWALAEPVHIAAWRELISATAFMWRGGILCHGTLSLMYHMFIRWIICNDFPLINVVAHHINALNFSLIFCLYIWLH